MRIRCWATTASVPPSDVPEEPSPQSNKSYIREHMAIMRLYIHSNATTGLLVISARILFKKVFTRRQYGLEGFWWKDLFKRRQFGSVLDVSEAGVLASQLFYDVFVFWVLRGQYQRWVITQLPQIL